MKSIVYDLSDLNKEELEIISNRIIEENKFNKNIKLNGNYTYSTLLTENILLKYFYEFKNNPWESFVKYFKSPANIYPILAIDDLVKKRDINKQVYIRNDILMDCLLEGKTPKNMDMETYDSLVPSIIEKRQKKDSRKYLR